MLMDDQYTGNVVERSPHIEPSTKFHDALKAGPCSSQYDILTKCHQEKGLHNGERMELEKFKTMCVTETDLFSQCINRNPSFLHEFAQEATKTKK